MKKVAIYSTPTCHFCKAVKELFAEHNIQYTNYDVASDREKAQEMMQKSGQMGVPVIFVDEEMIIGFDEARLKMLLGI
ncbi:MAG: glutaredoxin family protein [Candidatus Vogelbacteria bacterium]|nr:glutaredoxin family protein [Candidatus Vogelbacteria bacterium]